MVVAPPQPARPSSGVFSEFESIPAQIRMKAELEAAIQLLASSGVVFTLPPARHLSLPEAASRLDVGPGWVRDHLSEFPHAWRLPSNGQAGELRIPAPDVDALAKRRRISR